MPNTLREKLDNYFENKGKSQLSKLLGFSTLDTLLSFIETIQEEALKEWYDRWYGKWFDDAKMEI